MNKELSWYFLEILEVFRGFWGFYIEMVVRDTTNYENRLC